MDKNTISRGFNKWYAVNEGNLPSNKFDFARLCFNAGLVFLEAEQNRIKALSKARKEKKLVPEDFIADDKYMKETRYSLTGMYYDAEEDYTVITDSHYLLKLHEKCPDEAKRGKIIDRNGNEIKGNFPAWRKVMPDYSLYEPLALTVKDIEIMCSATKAKALPKLRDTHVKVVFSEDRNYIVTMLHLKLALKFMTSFPDSVMYHTGDFSPNRALAVKSGDNEFIFMPCKAGTENSLCLYCKDKTMVKVEN